MNIIIATEIKDINKKLDNFWGKKTATKHPFFVPLLFMIEDKAYLFAHHINDGYFEKVYIDDLFVKKKYRREGHATSLIKKLLDYCQGHKVEEVYAILDPKVRDLYAGFEESGIAMSKTIK